MQLFFPFPQQTKQIGYFCNKIHLEKLQNRIGIPFHAKRSPDARPSISIPPSSPPRNKLNPGSRHENSHRIPALGPPPQPPRCMHHLLACSRVRWPSKNGHAAPGESDAFIYRMRNCSVRRDDGSGLLVRWLFVRGRGERRRYSLSGIPGAGRRLAEAPRDGSTERLTVERAVELVECSLLQSFGGRLQLKS